ncbi:ParB N-terminal domain-containing protein [Lutimaribacter sp. EGI FJ00015]|uniref:ParB N-terminal domain-containing protein n=1 Tax=Lutimaribacter degradans TaxID=2945989 RepID=A0ACC6A198_9RHOB|nr:ParB N-terminal domain-containing protein [Lutimaribacter sp. EGI FJ00013]MCM2563855.1 ParB N-terminal domain-containing protein [Lutimaribacter sp. EGI FJ00013]MCO0615046.1 ParB N-terminal domain-containing protein [Lutimaribacter sp. EGI FJ00015]MCO0637718.1 ParB N-terminal domain-containing protein [Lutimaribacter sp. EGI FJ00014]
MAKRKRLSAPNPIFLDGADAQAPAPSQGPAALAATRAPIADVARDSSAAAALDEVVGEMARAREEGRLITRLPLDRIKLDHLVRDRVVIDDEDMQALITSIEMRGQQTPIEVVATGDDRYGLISGWRRCQAIARLHDQGKGDGSVLAIQRQPESASDAYRAMVEENEIRAGLSYFERARIVHVAVGQRVFQTQKEALQSLFSAASRARRSKIGSFVSLVQVLGEALRFPQAIGERLGLRLAKLIEADPEAAAALARDLAEAPAKTAEDEQARLARWAARLEQGATRTPPHRSAAQASTPRPGLVARYHPDKNRLELSGEALTGEMRQALMRWLEGWR